MKNRLLSFLALLTMAANTLAQGTFQYDQQSYPVPLPPNIGVDIQSNTPIGESFVPSLSAVGFVQLEPFDGHPNNGLGATLYVNLRSDSMTGPILGSSVPVFIPETPSGGGVTNFLFSSPIAVVPGTTYFFEVEVQSGDLWTLNVIGNFYPSGTAYWQGNPQPGFDLWFREGVIVPEPSATWLSLLGGGVCFYVRRRTVG